MWPSEHARSRRIPVGFLLLPLVLAFASARGAHAEGDAPGSDPGSFIGVYARSNSNVLEASNVYEGITVTSVVENSPAAAAGLEAEDILLEANGIAMDSPERLDDLAETLPPGSPLRFRVERNGRVIEMQAQSVVRRSPPDREGVAQGASSNELRVERRRLGFEFRDGPPDRLRALGLSPRFGVEVHAVAERSPLREAGVEAGDVITEVDGRAVPSADALLTFFEGLRERRTLALTVVGPGGEPRDVDVELYRPEPRLTQLRLPPLLSIERGPDTSEYSFLLGAFRWTRLANGSRLRLLWLFRFETGSPDELIDMGTGS